MWFDEGGNKYIHLVSTLLRSNKKFLSEVQVGVRTQAGKVIKGIFKALVKLTGMGQNKKKWKTVVRN